MSNRVMLSECNDPGNNVSLFCTTPAVGLARNLGRKAALEMLLTGAVIDATEARTKGLINRVVQSILAKSAVAVRIGKAMFFKQREMGLTDAYDYASEVMACSMKREDAGEDIAAFMHQRKPRVTFACTDSMAPPSPEPAT